MNETDLTGILPPVEEMVADGVLNAGVSEDSGSHGSVGDGLPSWGSRLVTDDMAVSWIGVRSGSDTYHSCQSHVSDKSIVLTEGG